MSLRELPGHLALALLATWPRASAPLSRLLGHPDADCWNHAWGAWWFARSFARGELPWRTDLLMAPDGGVLWFIDPLGALIGVPLVPLLGPAGAYNAALVLQLTLASWAMARLASAIGGRGPHVWLASMLLLFGTYVAGEVHSGVSEAVGVGWSLLALTAGLRAHQGDPRAWLPCGIWLGVAAVGTPYYGLGAGLALVTVWASRGTRRWRGPATSLAIAVALFAPVGVALWASVKAPDALVGRADSTHALGLLRHNAVDPRTYLWPHFQSVDHEALGESYFHAAYLGPVTVLLALRGLRRTARWGVGAAALVSLCLALGPWLFVAGDYVELAGHRVPLPYRLLQAVLPDTAITHPLRLAVPGLALMGALAAAGVARWRWGSLAAAAALADVLLLGGAPRPAAVTPPLDDEVYQFIAEQPPVGPAGSRAIVLDLPAAVGDTMATSRYLFAQTVHGRPIPYGPDPRAGNSTLASVSSLLPLLLVSSSRPEERAWMLPRTVGLARLDPQELVDFGLQWVVVHRELDRGGQGIAVTEDLLTRLFGEPRVFGLHALYAVEPGPVVGLNRQEREAIREAAGLEHWRQPVR